MKKARKRGGEVKKTGKKQNEGSTETLCAGLCQKRSNIDYTIKAKGVGTRVVGLTCQVKRQTRQKKESKGWERCLRRDQMRWARKAVPGPGGRCCEKNKGNRRGGK